MEQACVGKAKAPELAQVFILRSMDEQEQGGCCMTAWSAWTAIEKIAGCLEGIRPEAKWHGSVEEHGAHAVI